MEWIADPTGWLGLGTLILLEIVLGIDNLIFIAILVDKLPPRQRHLARIIGLVARAIDARRHAGRTLLVADADHAAVHRARRPDFGPRPHPDCGGLFLLFKATTELHGRLEGTEEGESGRERSHAAFWQIVAQIVILDFVFSIDSVITAVGMVDQFSIMVIAVLIAILAMMVAQRPAHDAS